jgi:hypothetical protein
MLYYQHARCVFSFTLGVARSGKWTDNPQNNTLTKKRCHILAYLRTLSALRREQKWAQNTFDSSLGFEYYQCISFRLITHKHIHCHYIIHFLVLVER